jgi:hypothetical protein
MASVKPTRMRELKEHHLVVDNAKMLRTMAQDYRTVKALRRAGWSLVKHWCPRHWNYCVVEITRHDSWTKRQHRINEMLDSERLLWTGEDIANVLGLDPTNQGVLGKIGSECTILAAFAVQVPRLAGSKRQKVYSYTPIHKWDLPTIRDAYRHQEPVPTPTSKPSTKR